jgi:DNA-binding Lrp family transcriptional regulator
MNMADLEMRLLNDFQRGFPLTATPFRDIAQVLDVGEQLVLNKLGQMQNAGSVSRVGAVFRPNRVGASALAALAVPAERLEEVASLVSAYPEINHNYEREHRFNLWFVVTAVDEARRASVLAEIEQRSGCPLLFLPMLADYHIDLGFDLHGTPDGGKSRKPQASNPRADFVSQPEDQRLIAAIQGGLPLVSRPYADVGRQSGMSEQQVISRLGDMQQGEVIKRIGIIVRHHELGFNANAMVVWDVPDAQVDALGRCIGHYDFITLCYQRRRQQPEWRYNLYCMIHGRDRETVMGHVQQLIDQCGLHDLPHEVLFSLRRFKQCGARYVELAKAA